MALTLDTKSVFTIFILLWTCASRAMSRTFYESSSNSIAKQHEEWMAFHNRVYADNAEKERRQQIFKDNLEFIEKHNNQGNKRYKLGLNRFADLTNEEFRASHTGALYTPPSQAHAEKKGAGFGYHNVSLNDVEQSLDWRKKGAVNEIKNQKHCGSCWAFATVAAVEGITQIKKGQLISLSEQQLVDCATNDGCGGFDPDKAFEYIEQSRGLARDADYPYQAIDGTCKDQMVNPVATISGHQDVTSESEEELLKAVTMQPVTIGIEGGGRAFQLYSNGVFTGEECGTQLDHAVTIIGYGEEDSTDGSNKYWLIRNSWGKTWGEDGYMKIQRNVLDSKGACGLAMHPSYPTL